MLSVSAIETSAPAAANARAVASIASTAIHSSNREAAARRDRAADCPSAPP
jgi:hypothetical protein